MIKIISYKPGHLDFMEMKSIYSEGVEAKRVDKVFYADAEHPIATILGDGKPIAVVGLVQIWSGVADVFAVTGVLVHKHPVGFHKAVVMLISKYQKKLKLHRIQMSVLTEYEDGYRWAKKLGFRCEGTMTGYGPDKRDHYMFARAY